MYLYPQPTFERIEIHVTWTGTGEFMTGHYSSNNTFQDIRMHSRSIGRYNEATVAGSITGETFSLNLEPVTVPDPYGYYPYPYPSSMIGKYSDGYMVIVKP